MKPVVEKNYLLPESTTRPADIFIPSWTAGKPAAFGFTMTSPLQSKTIFNAAEKAGVALETAEDRSTLLITLGAKNKAFLLYHSL